MTTIKQPLRPTYVRESLRALRDIYETESEFIAFWELYRLRERFKLSSMRYHNIWILNPILHISTLPEKNHRPDLTHVWWYRESMTNTWSAVLAGFGTSVVADTPALTVMKFEDKSDMSNPRIHAYGAHLMSTAYPDFRPFQNSCLGVLSVPRYTDDVMSSAVARHINKLELEIRSQSFKSVTDQKAQ
jgi:hypothetical protein